MSPAPMQHILYCAATNSHMGICATPILISVHSTRPEAEDVCMLVVGLSWNGGYL